MPKHTTRFSRQFHHASRVTIGAGAITMILLALGACGNTATVPTSPGPAPSTASFGSGSHIGTLTGAGSTFVAPFFDLAFARYHQQHPTVSISYAAVGSGAGIAAFSAKKTDFGASDVPMTASEQAAATGGASVEVPVALGAEVIVYHLDLPGGQRLHLTGSVIARIFLGQITNWNDSAITALNPGINLPNAPITVVHRTDGSGTTYIFSNYLSSIDPAWAAKVGTGKTLHWPVGQGAEGNGGVGTAVYTTPFSIGYVERTYAHGSLLSYAAIRNQAGHYVIPTTASIDAAADQKPHITATDFSIVNQPGSNSYPITGYSWALVYTHQPSQATGQTLVNLLDWVIHGGQAYAATLGYVTLPAQVQQLAHTALQQVTGPSGTHLLS